MCHPHRVDCSCKCIPLEVGIRRRNVRSEMRRRLAGCYRERINCRLIYAANRILNYPYLWCFRKLVGGCDAVKCSQRCS